MADQFVVPQFLDVESKIIGPITGRQFIILLVTILCDFIIYRLFLSVIPIILLGVPVTAFGVIFSFARVNGQPFHYIALNMIQTFRKPMIRVWDKGVSTSEIKARMQKEEVLPKVEEPVKPTLETSKLSELSLIVNTGGAYQSDSRVFEQPYAESQKTAQTNAWKR